MTVLRAENRILALKTMTRYQNERKIKQKSTNEKRIKKEDLILIKDKVRNNQKKRKLNVR